MEKLYDRIDWSNNTTPAINETNLNAMSKAIDDIDDRVIEIAGEAVEASTYATAAAGSASEAATYANNASDYATNASSSATTANSNMLTSEGYALGTQNGVAVSSDSPYYENNAKYYCEHAFSTTPEGYEALVNQVETNTTDISNTKSVIGSSYNASTNYAAGDRFTDNGVRYKVNVPCIGITPPNANYYEVISVDEDTKELESEIDTLNSSLTDCFDVISRNGAKNYVPYSYMQSSVTYYGVTVTPIGDGGYILNGTSTAFADFRLTVHGTANYNSCFELPKGEYILTGGYSNYDSHAQVGVLYNDGTNRNNLGFDSGSGFSFTQSDTSIRYEVKLSVWAGGTFENAIIYPMIRLASDIDDTYQPYAMTNKELTSSLTNLSDSVVQNGAHNLLPNTLSTQTINDVTLTVNDDGSITADGTASAQIQLVIGIPDLMDNTTYVFGGSPSGSSDTTYFMMLSNNTDKSIVGTNYTGDKEFDSYYFNLTRYPNTKCYLFIRSGVTVSNLTFYPIIRLATDSDSTYQPYAMTNKELTSSLTYSSYTDFTVNSDYLSSGNYNIVVYKNSYMCWITLNFKPIQSAAASVKLIENLPKPKAKVYFNIVDGNNNARRLIVSTNGAIAVESNGLETYWHNATIMYPI